jgi:hypothetical protein
MTAFQVWVESRSAKMSSGASQSAAAIVGSNCLPERLRAQLGRRRHAADAVSNLRELCECRDAPADWHGVAPQLPGPTLAFPLLVGRADRGLHVIAQAELLSQHARQCGVVGGHVVEVASTRDSELEAGAEPVQWRIALIPDHSHRGDCAARVVEVVLVLVGLQGEVVAEPRRLFVGMGVTPDRQEEAV